ncbi:MAG: pilus assembly protein PilM [Planctomycetota bacterium]|nr:MAG: pilus assembly protein PilM [Planctomycetota bacterium]
MVQLTQYQGRFDIVCCAERMVPFELHSASEYEHFCGEAVNQMLSEGDFVGRDAVSALNWDDLWIRNLRIPVTPADETEELVRILATERFGLDPSDVEIRFMPAGDVRQGTDIQQEVLVLGAGKTTIKNHINTLTRSGLQPAAIDAGPCAVFRPFTRYLQRKKDKNDVHVFVDLGYKAARVIVSRGSDLIFLKVIPIAGRQFEQTVSENLDLSPDEARQILRRLVCQYIADAEGFINQLDADEIVSENMRRAVIDTLRSVVDQLGKEMSLCLRYCSVTFRGLRYDKAHIVGGNAYNSDVLRLLSDQVGLPFYIGGPMRNIPWDSEAGGMNRRTGHPEWTTAVGLALKPAHELAGVA